MRIYATTLITLILLVSGPGSTKAQTFSDEPLYDKFKTHFQNNNNLLQGTYEFTGNLTEGREHVIDNNSNIIRDVKFDSIKKAVFIEGRFDVDMSESDDN